MATKTGSYFMVDIIKSSHTLWSYPSNSTRRSSGKWFEKLAKQSQVVIHIVSIVASSHFKIVLSSSVNGRALKKETQAKLFENAHQQ
jgi:hypothetical protein